MKYLYMPLYVRSVRRGISIFSFLFCVLFFGHSLKAQILVGAVAGGQSQWVIFNDKNNKDFYSTKPYVGFHAGGSVSFRVKKTFYLQTSILYAQKGKHLEGKIDKSFSNEVKYKYIDMPILFTREIKSKFGKKGRSFKVQLGAGPNVSYWLGGNGLLTSNDLDENGINPPDYNLPYHITFGKAPEEVVQGEMNVEIPNRLQLGLNFNVGLILEPANMNKFILAAQYQIGHTFLSQQSDGDFGLPGQLYYEDDLQVRSQGFALSLFYFIDLKLDEKNKGKSTLDINKIRKKK